MRDKVANIIDDFFGVDSAYFGVDKYEFADHLLANGVIVPPCVAMVEQFIKDGKIDKKRTAHNGRYAVVYIDKKKWGIPLIDITEQFYNSEKAEERIQVLKEREG